MSDGTQFQRLAPRPLSIYLGAALAMLGPDAAEDIVAAHKKSVTRMLEGIRKYQNHSYRRPDSPGEKIWQQGGTILTRFAAAANETVVDRGALLLIPSMINGSEILDLLPGKSFCQWLAGQGFEVYLLDWGTPAADAGLQDLEDGVVLRLLAAAAEIARRENNVTVDALGYCMGGTLLLAAAAKQPDLFNRLVLLSAPWDFHAGEQRMRGQVLAGSATALQLLEEKAALPVDWIQNVFAQVNPVLAIHKFSAFLEMAADSPEEQVFIAVEDWLNGGQDLPGGVARSCILDWYGHNHPGRGEWVDLAKLDNHPMLVVAAARDVLVPPESASAVARQISRATVLEPACGHISLMAGKQAQTLIWEPIRDWLLAVS